MTTPHTLLLIWIAVNDSRHGPWLKRQWIQPDHSCLLGVLKQNLKLLQNVVSHFRISHQPQFSSERPPVQLEITDAVIEESELIGTFMLPMAWNAQLRDQRLQLLQTPLKIHKENLILML